MDQTKGYNIDNSMFELKLNPPQNFAQYRQTEMDQSRVNTFTAVADLPYMSKRFALKRYLGLSEEEMARNAELWAEENNVPQKKQSKSNELRVGGVTQSGISSRLRSIRRSNSRSRSTRTRITTTRITRTDTRRSNTRRYRWWRTGIRLNTDMKLNEFFHLRRRWL